MAKHLHERLGLPPGNMTIEEIVIETWGSTVLVECTYRRPPVQHIFQLRFEECRSIQWYVQRRTDEILRIENAQLISHDLGLGEYERTARLASTLVELIISYGRLKIERLE